MHARTMITVIATLLFVAVLGGCSADSLFLALRSDYTGAGPTRDDREADFDTRLDRWYRDAVNERQAR